MEILKVIESGSSGNCYIYNNKIMIDCGVSYKKIKNNCDLTKIKIVIISHQHLDHFNKTTVKLLIENRPTLRFCIGKHLLEKIIDCGVPKKNIDIVDVGKKYDYGKFEIIPVKLYHDVENFGFRIFIKENSYKIFHATDTRTLEGIVAKNYNFYGIEGNYLNDEELHERAVCYEYEERVRNTHLSKEEATKWLLENMNDESVYEFLHQHVERNSVCKN